MKNIHLATVDLTHFMVSLTLKTTIMIIELQVGDMNRRCSKFYIKHYFTLLKSKSNYW
jgi:hypothetical protein